MELAAIRHRCFYVPPSLSSRCQGALGGIALTQVRLGCNCAQAPSGGPADILEGSGCRLGIATLQGSYASVLTYNNLVVAGVERSSVTYNTLVDAYVRAGQLREAKQVGVAAMEAGQPLDVWGHSTLIKGSLHDGDLAGAHALLHQMKRVGVPCNVVCLACPLICCF